MAQASRASFPSISYRIGQFSVFIQFPINPWKILGLNSASSSRDVKLAFKKMIASASVQNQALVSLANHILTSTAPRYQRQQGTDLYTIKNPDHFTVAAYGDTHTLRKIIERNASLIQSTDEHGRTLLYLACKSGFTDIVKMLLKNDADNNKIQRDGSTPLHAAAYFSHPGVVELLLEYGARTDIKNAWDQTALEESATIEIRNMIENPPPDLINSLAGIMKERKLVSEFKGYRTKPSEQMYAIEFIRHPNVYDAETRAKLPEFMQSWKLTWHGTRYKNLESIMEHGLLPAGKKGIKPPSGHFALGKEYQGIPNWAAAIFVSPSIWYAADNAYAEKVKSQGDEWCVLIKAYCKPGSYGRYDPTVFSYAKMENEPEYSEYRVPTVGDRKDEETVILRVESERNVVVCSVLFIRTRKLQDP
ncbi:ankyrin repeat domain-containing, partial [Paramuricea clavata]